jgi:8'-apo-carotenoid 13,14-cleaving dioxygenase
LASPVETAIRNVVTQGATALAAFNRARLPAPKAPHPFLTGIHTPMTAELTIEDLAVTGALPPALAGRYLRIGPNPIAADPRSHHWFVGDGMVHGLRLEGGRARWYRNRWVRSSAVTTVFNEPRTPGPRHSDFDTVNTNVLGLAGKTWALVEAGGTPVLLGETLESVAYDDFGGTLAGAFAAHPHVDPLTGEAHAITYASSDQSLVHHVVVGADGRVRREEPIRVSHGPSIHDCALTARFVLIPDLPVTFSMGALIAGHPFPYRWNPTHQARIGLLPREGAGDETIWCEVDPCYVFHVANAYDAPDGGVILDAVVYDTMFADAALQGPVAERAAFERWAIDPAARAVSRAVIDAAPQEFPRIDDRRFSQPHRYAYAMALPQTPDPAFVAATSLFKHDLATGARQVHDFGPSRYPGEFVFVPAHAVAAEDEGWLIGLVIDAASETTELVILNAQDFEGSPEASVRIPHRVPPGFHGDWLPSSR